MTGHGLARAALLGAGLASLACSGQIADESGAPPAVEVPASPWSPGGPAAPPAAAPPAAAPPGAPAAVNEPPPAGGGILGCPTSPLPAYAGSAADAPLSGAFKRLCSTCHGPGGEGQALYPALPGKLDQAAFVDAVRKGTKAMPPFGGDVISDAELAADFRALAGRAGSGKGGAAPAWTPARLEQVYARGLAVWREPDEEGAACASCHSPDALDLAVIAYPDAAVLRRALKHLPPDDALAVRDLVHAQRRRFRITAPCSTDWRPFQPGGAPLPGATIAEQEMSFAAHLQERGLLVVTGRVDSLERAREARDQLLAIDLRRLRIGIPLARWTEDGFNGPEHRTINDWLPGLPRIARPGKEAALRALEDAYLADPSTANLVALVRQQDALTHDGGFAATFEDQFGHGENWLTGAMLTKRHSLLVGQHFLRLAVQGKRGWLELAPVPFPEVKDHFNPFFGLAQSSLGAPCANNSRCGENYITQFPPEILAEAPPKPANRPDQHSSRFISQLTHPWFTLGQIFDQGLLRSGGAGHNTTEAVYWNALHFPHDRIHKLFFNTHRFLVQAQYETERGWTGLAPVVRANNDAAPPLLNGDWVHVAGMGGGDASDARSGVHARMTVNVQRMLLYLMRERLKAGSAVSVKKSLLATLKEWRDAIGGTDGLMAKMGQAAWKAKWPEMAAELALVRDTVTLADEVTALVNAAQDVKTDGAGSAAY